VEQSGEGLKGVMVVVWVVPVDEQREGEGERNGRSWPSELRVC
jgi:hypothetical protein